MIDLSNVIALALGSDDVLQIQDAIGTVLWQKIIYYNVSISAGSNGTVSVNGVSGNYSQSVPSGTVLTIEGTGNTGYDFDEWSDGNTTNPRTITVTGDLTLTAAFESAAPAPEYFYIEDVSGSDNTLSIKKSSNNAPTIEVFKSTDGTNWSSMGNTDTTAITATIPANGKLYLKATVNQWGNAQYSGNNITTIGNCNVGGNIMSLLYGDNFENQTTFPSGSSYNFEALFKNCYVVNAATLQLPATTLVNGCYDSMFVNCSQLTTTPALPATTLANDCYYNMFQYCSSLTTAPALPATTLTENCYIAMFDGCTSLTTAPVLPATTLAKNCYLFMFQSCTSLTTAPVLPATTLADSCYKNMFSFCTSLTTAPTLPATTLANSCYSSMFYNCTSLTTAPALPATTLTEYCYDSMFQSCTSLTTAPVLPATTLANSCYDAMFQSCTSLTTAPALPVTTLTRGCYSRMFYGCTSLTTTPVLPATTLAHSCYVNMFNGCTSLSSVTTYANDISATNCIDYWLYNVAAQGDFYNLGSAIYPSGESGIPSGWTEHNSL